MWNEWNEGRGGERKPDRERMDAMTVTEVLGGLERFASGVPQEEFRKIASGQKKHKL